MSDASTAATLRQDAKPDDVYMHLCAFFDHHHSSSTTLCSFFTLYLWYTASTSYLASSSRDDSIERCTPNFQHGFVAVLVDPAAWFIGLGVAATYVAQIRCTTDGLERCPAMVFVPERCFHRSSVLHLTSISS